MIDSLQSATGWFGVLDTRANLSFQGSCPHGGQLISVYTSLTTYRREDWGTKMQTHLLTNNVLLSVIVFQLSCGLNVGWEAQTTAVLDSLNYFSHFTPRHLFSSEINSALFAQCKHDRWPDPIALSLNFISEAKCYAAAYVIQLRFPTCLWWFYGIVCSPK